MSDLIERLRENFSGRDRWYVMNTDESGYCISFDHQFEAEEWMAKYLRENPGYIERNGFHIVKQRWLTGAEELGSEAADALQAANARIGELESMTTTLRQEAQNNAQEARTANATIAEIYQVVTGGTGEPGNWHGAEPVRQRIADLEIDKVRLDWLDKNMFHREKNEFDARIWRDYTMWVTFAPNGVQGSARNIIDASRAKESK